ncbi:MAG TPA: hypothetical protein VHT53_12815 [Candidatus Elarobacter sp.]|nr:hypothetical protein [Candidatus Elarobacter sp.]
MSAHTIVWWTVAAGLAALLIATGVQLAAAARAAYRCAEHAAGIGDLPVAGAIERAQIDMARIQADAEAVRALVERAAAAVAIIRRGPVPPELLAAIRGVRAEIAAFRRFARR